MSLEQEVGRIATALERIATAAEGNETPSPDPASGGPSEVVPAKKTTKKKTAKKTSTPAASAADQPTEDDLRAIFQEYVGKKGNEEGTAALKELITRYGAAKIGEVKPEDYAAIIEEVKKWS